MQSNFGTTFLADEDLADRLRGAEVNQDTRWPDGFDPATAGVVMEDA